MQMKVHELRLQERNSRDEEKALLSRALISQEGSKGSSSKVRRRGRKRKGKDRSGEVDGEKKKKQFDKPKVKCFNCQKLGHFADECKLSKRDKSKGKDKMHMAQEYEDK